MQEEASFLRNIARAPGDNLPRLVFADWLDEHGEAARAEFIRVQCELARFEQAADRRDELRARERFLLDAHRQEWILDFGLPIEDVRFKRGLISAMRLREWDRGKLLESAIAPRFATLEELDLSGLGIGDSGLEQFARRADFPAMRKLHLNGNGITDAGVETLATAEGLPNLASVYLFDNSVGESGRWTLRESPHFSLVEVDHGEAPTGYLFSAGRADAARRDFLRTHLAVYVQELFQKYEHLQSAMLCVAQYWNDEADDAIQAYVIVSELPEPTLVGVNDRDEEAGLDPNVPNTHIKQEYSEGGSALYLFGTGVRWDANHDAIPQWAPFTKEGVNQGYDSLADAYSPAVMFYRHGGYEILPMLRPQLDGIRPLWDAT